MSKYKSAFAAGASLCPAYIYNARPDEWLSGEYDCTIIQVMKGKQGLAGMLKRALLKAHCVPHLWRRALISWMYSTPEPARQETRSI